MRIETVRHLRSMVLLGGLLLFPAAASLLAHAFGLTAVVGGWLSTPRPEPPPPTEGPVPPPGWRERAYLAANPDVAAAVRSGALRSGYEHYVQHGEREGRPGGLPGKAARPPVPAPPVPPPVPAPAPSVAAVPSPAPAPTLAPEARPAEPAAVPRPSVKPRPPDSPGSLALPVSAPAAVEAPAEARGTAGPVVRAVRVGRHPDFVRVVLESSAPLPAGPRLAADRRTLTVDLGGAGWTAARNWAGGPAALLASYAVEEADGAGRFVLHGSRTLALRHVMRLGPDERSGHRLVIDLAPADAAP